MGQGQQAPAPAPAQPTVAEEPAGPHHTQGTTQSAALTSEEPTNKRPGFRGYSTHGGLGSMGIASIFATDFGDEDVDEVDDPPQSMWQRWCPGLTQLCSSQKQRRGPCYYCFVFVFLAFAIIFPLFLKWLVTSPVPSEFWNSDFDTFPPLMDKDFITEGDGLSYNMTVSPIPRSFFGCNHSCVGASASGATSEVSFRVDMTLDAPGFEHTAYPILLASNDFSTWYVAADRRDSTTSPFYPSHIDELADVYLHTTDVCTRPPELKETLTDVARSLEAEEGFGSLPIYLLACITWETEDIAWHETATELTGADVGQRCQAVGGVCGWPCASNPLGAHLPSCSKDGIIAVGDDSVAGVSVGASFEGDVSVYACVNSATSSECTTTASPMSEWPCHKCAVTSVMFTQLDPNTQEMGNKSFQLRYDSLPKMEVYLKDVQLGQTDAVPRVHLMTSTVDPQGRGPAGMYGGKWKKLYNNQQGLLSDPIQNPPPVPLALLEEAYNSETQDVVGLPAGLPHEVDVEALVSSPGLVDGDRTKMRFLDKSKLTLSPSACFASRGPLYLVACAVNESTYQDSFEFRRGQSVAPPPFNDRCLAVRGVCGHACSQSRAPTLDKCDANGFISKEYLMDEKFKVPVNDHAIVYVFMFTLLFGFAVRLMTYFPGLFTPDKHPQHYKLEQTKEFKYIAVVTPSGGETKACCVRNLVGAISSLPVGCQCPYHVVFADEGHRHPQKICFRALVQVLAAVPQKKMRQGPSTDSRNTRLARAAGHCKEENLKAFTKFWVEQSRNLTLELCKTAKLADQLKKLNEVYDKHPTSSLTEKQDKEAVEKKIKQINETIDHLCGLSALRLLQKRLGWPKAEDSRPVDSLQKAIQRLRAELCAPEDKVAASEESAEAAKVLLHLDDCEAFVWHPGMSGPLTPASSGAEGSQGCNDCLYTLHYVARGKPEEDERVLKVQHVARSMWYYKIPMDAGLRSERTWLEWRKRAKVYQDGERSSDYWVVPLRTSRGKAGGLNFVENYLYHHTRLQNRADPILKHALFAIADARHQFQPDFFHETIPYFFKQSNLELDFKVAFTQSPQYFPEMPDDTDYLDTNNANFFRLNCMLRNCCGGVSSCGTNGTWLVRDRRAGFNGMDSIWENEQTERNDFVEKRERRFFHESCKVEDTASSLDRVVKGRYSRYVPVRLSYGMAKDPTDYLAAVQRWAEGGVVLSLQTFLSCGEGIHMIWMALGIFVLFVLSVANIVYGWGYTFWLTQTSFILTGDSERFSTYFLASAEYFADLAVETGTAEEWYKDVWVEMFFQVQIWLCVVVAFFVVLAMLTSFSYYLHNHPWSGKPAKRTRFPTSMAQWARLAITLDNLTYFFWFWTAFFWVFFNYYGIWGRRLYNFEPNGIVLFTYLLQVFGWSLVISSASRFTTETASAASEVFFLSLTNVWRTTQLFYITAPLTTYSIIMGISDFARHRTLNEDISYWIGGDRGAVSKSIAQWWTLLLILGAIVSHIFFWLNMLPFASVGGLLIVTFIALDVMHPCAFLWLGTAQDKLPDPPGKERPAWQRFPLRLLQLAFSLGFWRNWMRSVVFHPRSTSLVKWIGPVQNVVFPTLTFIYPELGVNQALLLLTSSRV